jgi:hypothetical protein
MSGAEVLLAFPGTCTVHQGSALRGQFAVHPPKQPRQLGWFLPKADTEGAHQAIAPGAARGSP